MHNVGNQVEKNKEIKKKECVQIFFTYLVLVSSVSCRPQFDNYGEATASIGTAAAVSVFVDTTVETIPPDFVLELPPEPAVPVLGQCVCSGNQAMGVMQGPGLDLNQHTDGFGFVAPEMGVGPAFGESFKPSDLLYSRGLPLGAGPQPPFPQILPDIPVTENSQVTKTTRSKKSRTKKIKAKSKSTDSSSGKKSSKSKTTSSSDSKKVSKTPTSKPKLKTKTTKKNDN